MLDVLVFFFFTAIFLALVAVNVLVGLDLNGCLKHRETRCNYFVIKKIIRETIKIK